MPSVKRILAGSAVALGLATSVTVAGVGSPAANAASISTTIAEIRVMLTESEGEFAEASLFAVILCETEVLPQLKQWITVELSAERCGEALNHCSMVTPLHRLTEVYFTATSYRCGVYG